MITIGRDMFWGTVPVTIANNLKVSGTTIIYGAATCNTTLNVIGNITTSGLSVFTMNSNIISFSTNSTLNINNLSSNTGLITPNNISLTGNNPTYSLGGG